MNLVEHAKRELALIGEDRGLADNLVEVVAKFAEFGHSGGSAPFAVSYLEKLLSFKPLSPITSDPAEWEDRSEMSGAPMWQNVRDPRVFSPDGGKTWSLLADEQEDTSPEPGGALIEIFEKDATTSSTGGNSVVVPNEVRINGTPLLVADKPITIHEIEIPSRTGVRASDMAMVTLTLYARRVTIAAEGDLA